MYGNFDLTQSVPILSVTFLAVTCFMSIAVPLLAVYLFRKKFRAGYQALLYGIADYLTLEYMLCNVLWMLLLLIPVFRTYPSAYIIVGLVIGCIIFEVGRYYIIGLLQKHNTSFSSLFLFATGISGMNAILRVMVKSFESFVIAITINDTGLEVLAAEAGENALSMLQSIEPMLTCQPFIYLMTGLDVFVNLLFHIAVTILLYAVYTKHIQNYFLPVVIGIRFLYELPGYLYSYGLFITNAYVAEGITVIVTAAAAYLAYRILTAEMPDELASLAPADEKQAFPKFNANVRKNSIRENANILSGKNNGQD